MGRDRARRSECLKIPKIAAADASTWTSRVSSPSNEISAMRTYTKAMRLQGEARQTRLRAPLTGLRLLLFAAALLPRELHDAANVGRPATLCGLPALALGTNAPTVFRDGALGYPVGDATQQAGSAEQKGATVFGSSIPV